ARTRPASLPRCRCPAPSSLRGGPHGRGAPVPGSAGRACLAAVHLRSRISPHAQSHRRLRATQKRGTGQPSSLPGDPSPTPPSLEAVSPGRRSEEVRRLATPAEVGLRPMGRDRAKAILDRLGAGATANGGGQLLESVNPATGQAQGSIRAITRAEYDGRVTAALRRFEEWRMRPAPKRGDIGRRRSTAPKAYSISWRAGRKSVPGSATTGGSR